MDADRGSWEGQMADVQGPIDLSGLSDALKELRKRVPQTAQAFDTKHLVETFEECEDDLAESTKLIWDDFLQKCAPYQDAINKFRDKVRMWPLEMVEFRENTIERLQNARDALRDIFRRTITEIQDGEPVAAPETVAVAAAAAEKEVQEARLGIEKHKTAVTGNPNGDIPAKSSTTAFWVGGVAAVLYGFVEVMAGTDYFREVGSVMGAIGAMALLVIIVSFLAVAVGMTGKRWLYWRHASRAFEERLQGRVIPGTDGAAEFYGLPPEIKWIFAVCFIVLLIGSTALAGWRIRLAESNELLQGTSAIVWIVFVSQWLLVFVEFIISPGYDPEHHWTLKRLEDELAVAQERLHAARPREIATVPRASRLPTGADAAVSDYQKTVKDLKQNLAEAAAEARKIRDQYFRRHHQCADALEDRVIPFFRVLMVDLGSAVRRPCIQAGIDPKRVGEVDRPDISKLCVMGDDSTFARLSDFKPKIDFPADEVVVDFEEFYRRMQKEIRDQRNEEIRDDRRGELRASIRSSSPRPSAVAGSGTQPDVAAAATAAAFN